MVIGNLVTTQLDAEDTLRMVGSAFGVRVKDQNKSEMLMTLEAFFVSQAAQGKRCLLIVDEAQNLSARAVEELRMLSNFQFGSQALLQTFLVGQPEFRTILQRPEMEQFRQRVAATCHIGPLDGDETQRYIEHRIKCAGGTGKPTFEMEAFTAIYKASQGIPRRINSLCDRLLLLGFMSGKSHFELADVNEVLNDVARETELSEPVHAPRLNGHSESRSLAARVDLNRFKLDAADARALTQRVGQLNVDQQAERMQRLEASVLRLEQINLQTLDLMQQLVQTLSGESAPDVGEPKPNENKGLES